MRIGSLRKKIALQAEQPSSDGAGGYALAWTTLATVWAEIEPVSGADSYTAGHLEGRVTHKVTIRWRGDLTPTTDMRVLYGARGFNIHAVLNQDERNHFVTLMVEEGGAA